MLIGLTISNLKSLNIESLKFYRATILYTKFLIFHLTRFYWFCMQIWSYLCDQASKNWHTKIVHAIFNACGRKYDSYI